MRPFKSVQIALLLCAVAALIFGGAAAVGLAKFLRHAVSTEGTVIRLDWHVDMRRVRSTSGYKAVVRYRRADGSTGEFVDEAGSDPPAYSVGEKVRVLYDRAYPAVAKIDSFRSLWLVPVSELLAGVLILGVLAALRVAGLRRWGFRLRLRLPRPRREGKPAPPGRFASRVAYCIPAWCWPFLLLYVARGDWSRGGLDSRLSLAIFFLCNFPPLYAWLKGRLPWLEMVTLALIAPFLVWAALVLRA